MGTIQVNAALSAETGIIALGARNINYVEKLDAGMLTVNGGIVKLDGVISGTTIDFADDAWDWCNGTQADVTLVGALQLSTSGYITVTNGMMASGASEFDLSGDAQIILQSGTVRVGGACGYLESNGAVISLRNATGAGTINISGIDKTADLVSGALANIAVIKSTARLRPSTIRVRLKQRRRHNQPRYSQYAESWGDSVESSLFY
jgi:hypothetical protein